MIYMIIALSFYLGNQRSRPLEKHQKKRTLVLSVLVLILFNYLSKSSSLVASIVHPFFIILS